MHASPGRHGTPPAQVQSPVDPLHKPCAPEFIRQSWWLLQPQIESLHTKPLPPPCWVQSLAQVPQLASSFEKSVSQPSSWVGGAGLEQSP
jgi:hypothetical protein